MPTMKPVKGRILTAKNRLPFVIAFHDPLEKHYSFESLQKTDLKALQSFLDKISQMSISEAEHLYLRKPDHQDFVDVDEERYQMQHFKVSEKFRLHGYYDDNGIFMVIRLDPEHRFNP